jgi:hypothetical protein
MSRFQEFCYLVVQRHKANNKRHRLLRQLNKKLDEFDVRYRHHVQQQYAQEERQAYRNHAEAMKSVAKNKYTPLRQELNIRCHYCGSNNVTYLEYDGETYDRQQIENHANAYLFETIMLKDDTKVNTAYEEIL